MCCYLSSALSPFARSLLVSLSAALTCLLGRARAHTVIPLASLFFLVPLLIANRRDMADDDSGRERRARLIRKFSKIVMFTLFLLYPGQSSRAIGAYEAESEPDPCRCLADHCACDSLRRLLRVQGDSILLPCALVVSVC